MIWCNCNEYEYLCCWNNLERLIGISSLVSKGSYTMGISGYFHSSPWCFNGNFHSGWSSILTPGANEFYCMNPSIQDKAKYLVEEQGFRSLYVFYCNMNARSLTTYPLTLKIDPLRHHVFPTSLALIYQLSLVVCCLHSK